jgi:hypothetical protein
MTFLDVFEVSEHDKAIKNLVSVCLSVCVSVCLSVYLSVCLSSRLLHFYTILQRSRWCQKLCNLKSMN